MSKGLVGGVIACKDKTSSLLSFGVDRAVWTLAAKIYGRWGAVAQGGVAGSGKVHGLLAQGRRGGQPTTCDQTGLS